MDKIRLSIVVGGLFACGLVLLAAGARLQQISALAAPSTDVSGLITTNTIWSPAGNPYIVTGDVTVEPGVTLVIEPGVQVRFDGVYAFNVRGTLNAVGTHEQPIVFTSNKPSPLAGDWGVLDIRADSQHSRMEHVMIEYGGNNGKAGWYCASGALCVNTSSFRLEASTLRNSATRAVVLSQSSAIIYNNTFDHVTWEAIRLHTCDLAKGECHPLIVGNTFTNNQYPILLDNAQLPEMSGNTASGNQVNGFVLSPMCYLKGNNTFVAGDLPYVVVASGSWCHIGTYGVSTRLTIQPGTIFKLQNTIKFQYDTVITATGTVEQPIIFTSLKDDSVGGDTNNDGSITSPAGEDWGAIFHEGINVKASYQYVSWRYGGGTAFGWGPLVAVQGGANVTIRDSELSQAEVGVYTYDTATLDFQNNQVHHLVTSGVDTYSTGSVLVAGNRFTNITNFGVTVQRGAPVLRENFFQSNKTGVEVICSANPCSPVVSPHNRFIGSGQTGVNVRYPASVCVDGRRNGWGDVSGPHDNSTVVDACGMADNPGGLGAPVSNGVNYNPWEGGMGRPVISSPRCGVTAQNQPLVYGWAPAGALVSFYDEGMKIGDTVAIDGDTFSWVPGDPFSDGHHSLTAIAELGGQTSLPTPMLVLQVDSSLPYDPMGVRIRYDLHGIQYVQMLRDAQGCSSLGTSLETPVWVRPGTIMTVTVPVRSMTTLSDPVLLYDNLDAISSPHPGGQAATDSSDWELAPTREVPVQNDSGQTIIGYRVAAPGYYPGNRIYTGYGPVEKIPGGDIPGGMSGVIEVEGVADVILVTDDGALHRVDGNLGDPGFGGITVPENSSPANLTIHNNSGSTLFPVYIGRTSSIGSDYYGGSNLFLGVENERNEMTSLPANTDEDTMYHGLALGHDGGETIYYPVKIFIPAGRSAETTIENGYGVVDITNGFPGDICDFGLVPYEEQPGGTGHKPLNLLQYLDASNPQPKILEGGQLPRIRVGAGRYYWQAYYCDGSPAGHGEVVISTVHDTNFPQNFRLECQDKVQIGPYEYPLQKKPKNSPGWVNTGFDEYEAAFPMSPGPLSFKICRDGYVCSNSIGQVLIDPDGYVYDSSISPSAVIQGATVTCKMYDEDYQVWSRWPAELFESQVNPQVTLADGYYAFFVPPGLYRVEASAPGYTPHISPNIQVINEVVHYNVPLVPLYQKIYLPLVNR